MKIRRSHLYGARDSRRGLSSNYRRTSRFDSYSESSTDESYTDNEPTEATSGGHKPKADDFVTRSYRHHPYRGELGSSTYGQHTNSKHFRDSRGGKCGSTGKDSSCYGDSYRRKGGDSFYYTEYDSKSFGAYPLDDADYNSDSFTCTYPSDGTDYYTNSSTDDKSSEMKKATRRRFDYSSRPKDRYLETYTDGYSDSDYSPTYYSTESSSDTTSGYSETDTFSRSTRYGAGKRRLDLESYSTRRNSSTTASASAAQNRDYYPTSAYYSSSCKRRRGQSSPSRTQRTGGLTDSSDYTTRINEGNSTKRGGKTSALHTRRHERGEFLLKELQKLKRNSSH